MHRITINGKYGGITINEAVQKLKPGDVLTLAEGTYRENVRMENICGTPEAPIYIKGENLPHVDGGGGDTAFCVIDCEHLVIEGLRISHAHNGIYVKSTPERGAVPIHNITIRSCDVHGINGPKGGHGIAVYGANPHAPIINVVIENNCVHDNRLYWSEALVINGNVKGFVISGNTVWDNDNIGIDIIGFEGTAGDDPSVDCACNGKVFNNIVFNCNTTGNEAYWSENHRVEGEVWTGRGEGPFGGKYDRCCGGIYVDGGQHIEIYHNFVFDCDLGIEVATEHKPPLVTKDVHVHDNIIAGCTGWAGLVFGGYASHLGFTEECVFSNNILLDNDTAIAVQKSRSNVIKNNAVIGGWEAISFNGDIAANNDFEVNCWENTNKDNDYFAGFGELPELQRNVQIITTGLISRAPSSDFSFALPEGMGTAWRPDEKWRRLYMRYTTAQAVANKAAAFLQSKPMIVDALPRQGYEIRGFLEKCLWDNGFDNVFVKDVLKQAGNMYMVQIAARYDDNCFAQATTTEGVRIEGTEA